jgi:hypothetical protein
MTISRDMRKQTLAGIKAGALVNLLFTAGFVGLFFVLANISPLTTLTVFDDVAKSTSMPHQAVVLFLSFALVIPFLFSGLVGAVVGLIFVKAVNKLPLRSVYSKSLLLAFVIWLPFLAVLNIPVILVLSMFIGLSFEGLCFAYLYSHWTKTNSSARESNFE